MSSVVLSTMQKEPVKIAAPAKDPVQCISLEKPKLSVSDDGFVDLNDWDIADQRPTNPLRTGQAKQSVRLFGVRSLSDICFRVSNAAQTNDFDEHLGVGSSWLTLKKNLERKINNKRQQGLNCRYELWKEDQQRSALMEEKLLHPFVEEDESLKHNLSDSFSEDDTDDGQEPLENSTVAESKPLLNSNLHIDPGDDIESKEPSVDNNASENPKANQQITWAVENDSDDQSEVSFNFVPRTVVSSDDDDDSNCNALPCPTLNVDSTATSATPAYDSHAETELSVSDLFAKPSDLSSDLALANLFFDDSKQEGDSFSANVSGYNRAHLSRNAELSSTHDGSLSPKEFSHKEELLNFRIPQDHLSVGLNCNTESLSLENFCSGEFPDSGDQVPGSSRSKSRSSLTFDRLGTDGGMPSPIGYSKKMYRGLVLDNDSADDLELLCSAPFISSSPMPSKVPSSYHLDDVLDENARDGYPASTTLGNVAKKNPDLFDAGESDSSESDAEIDLIINNADNPSSRQRESLPKSRQKHLQSEFLDIEAELSGSDDSGDEEDVDDNDEYEEDFIDASSENLKTYGELRAEIGKIHNKQLIEEDAKMINLFKEKLLDSREVRTGLRHRRMGWATARGEDLRDAQLSEDKEDPSEVLVDDSLSRWQMARREKAEWLLEQEHPLNSDDSETETNTASVIFGYGMQVCSGTSSNSRKFNKASTVVSSVEDGSIALTASRIDSHISDSLLRREKTKLELAFKCASDSNESRNNAFMPASLSEQDEEWQSQTESIPLQKRRRLFAEQCLETVFRHV
ncbi:Claspin [Trichuris trichiura]|uniref:Claspin n=1 Tax=Trichuris trichiura TaxID=36087 RepID=A0A077YWY4_TRITR|nr:Claspin [Trichuris trichiura]